MCKLKKFKNEKKIFFIPGKAENDEIFSQGEIVKIFLSKIKMHRSVTISFDFSYDDTCRPHFFKSFRILTESFLWLKINKYKTRFCHISINAKFDCINFAFRVKIKFLIVI